MGSGIVIDSDAKQEYAECELKSEFLTKPAQRFDRDFSLIETLLWDGCYPLLELHLDRLTDSAEYFGIECVREAVKAALNEYAREFDSAGARRVRLLVDREGRMNIEDRCWRRAAMARASKPARWSQIREPTRAMRCSTTRQRIGRCMQRL